MDFGTLVSHLLIHIDVGCYDVHMDGCSRRSLGFQKDMKGTGRETYIPHLRIIHRNCMDLRSPVYINF